MNGISFTLAATFVLIIMAAILNSYYASADSNSFQSDYKFQKKCGKAVEKEDRKKANQAEDQFKRHTDGGQAGCALPVE